MLSILKMGQHIINNYYVDKKLVSSAAHIKILLKGIVGAWFL